MSNLAIQIGFISAAVTGCLIILIAFCLLSYIVYDLITGNSYNKGRKDEQEWGKEKLKILARHFNEFDHHKLKMLLIDISNCDSISTIITNWRERK